MERIRVFALTLTLLLAVILVLAPAASAESSKTPLDVYEVPCVVTPGYQWVAGETLHIRGQENHSIFYDPETFEIRGENSVVGNVNINLKTGEAHYFGTFSSIYLPESETDTFDGTWNGDQSPEGGFFGRARGQGTGEVAGKKIKISFRGLDPSEVPLELLIILSQPPWTECEELVGVFRDTGFVHSRGGS